MNNESQKPWLNSDGSPKSDQELREICKDWGPSVWEEYLTNIEVTQKEDTLVSSSNLDKFSAQECAGLLFSLASEEQFPLLKAALNSCIRELPTKQRRVIHQYYWEGKTIGEIARLSGVSKQAIQKTMKAALERLKVSLTRGVIQSKVEALKEVLSA